MKRRHFLKTAGTVTANSLMTFGTSAASATTAGQADQSQRQSRNSFTHGNWHDPSKTWHFFDLWHFDHVDQLTLRQGTPQWQREATFVSPPIGNLSAWPTVFRDESSNRWRMLYSADWKPYTLMIAESDDGRIWQPSPQPQIEPEGGKLAPHHIYTLPGGSGGGVYRDPVAANGFPFKVFVHQQGKPVYERAMKNPDHQWHDIARKVGEQRFINEEFTLVSRDGLQWEPRFDMAWSMPDWHPEPPLFGFYNRHIKQHSMTVRPGWGDRRQCLQTSADFQTWSGPELLLQPDFNDDELMEMYGMPVFPYGDGYVGLLWVFHCESSQPTRGFNRFTGPLDCQLAFSHDGLRFSRGSREPFITTGMPGEASGGAIQPSCLVETEDELRIYSAASKVHHGRGGEAKRRQVGDAASITLHTLRKDGLTFLETTGDQGRFISKPLVLQADRLCVNAAAPHGEIRFQLTDIKSQPIEGFTFEDCRPLSFDDKLNFDLRWKSGQVKDVVGKIVRLEMSLRHARLFAIRGQFHFIDAQDYWLIKSGLSLPE